MDTKIQISGWIPVPVLHLCCVRQDLISGLLSGSENSALWDISWIWIQVEPKMLIRSRSSFEGPASGSSKDEKEQIKKQIL